MEELKKLRYEVLNLRNMNEISTNAETKLLYKLNALQEAISVKRCCKELKGKEERTFKEYLKENGFTHKIDYTYLDVDGNKWLEEEIKILMKPNY